MQTDISYLIMKVALINEESQAEKNEFIYESLKNVADKHGHTVVNMGMHNQSDITFNGLNLGVIAALLLNSDAVDLVITGCGSGQGALGALNAFPGVFCGYCIDAVDAYLFLQMNNGNALALPFAKGFGWSSELNLEAIFERALSIEKGHGYPKEARAEQNKETEELYKLKADISGGILHALRAIEPKIVKQSVASENFQEYFFANSQSQELTDFVKARIK